MLEGLRKAGQNWLGKTILTILFGVLILSFAIWGIGDIFRGGFGGNSVARVGAADIGIEAMRRAYNNDLQQLQQRARQQVTNAEARAFGIDRNALQRLVTESVMDQDAQRLGLSYTPEQVARGVVDMPAFKDPAGKFDRDRFLQVIRGEGYNEAAFFQIQAQVTKRQHLADGIAGGGGGSSIMLDAMHRYRNEERRIAYVIIGADKAGEAQAPDQAALQAHYEQRKSQYRTREYRGIRYISISPVQFSGQIEVTEADLRAAYDRELRAGRLGTLEKRTIDQLTFATEAEAAAAIEKIKAGTAFEALAAERGVKEADYALGSLTRLGLNDPAIAEAAFSAGESEIVGPVKGALVTAVLRVSKIEAGSAPGFNWVSEQLKPLVMAQKIASDSGVRRAVGDLHDKIENLRADGKSLEEAAKQLELELLTIAAVDRDGNDPAGVALPPLPDQAAVLKAAFESGIGTDTEAIRTRENGYIWFELAKIDPARERPFDEVQDQVRQSVIVNDTTRRLAAFAGEMLKKLGDNGDLALVAADTGGKVEEVTLKRDSAGALGRGAVAAAFASPAGKPGDASTADGQSRVLFKVLDSKLEPRIAGGPVEKAARQAIEAAIGQDLMTLYVQRRQADLGVSINDRALLMAIGATAETN